jgi:predicted phosphodiesterase
MPFEHQLRILHFSDLHERVALEWMDDKRKAKVRLSEATRRQVLDDSNFLEVIKKEIGQVDLVCFTGDAADWGLAGEFKKATGRLDDILKASSVSRDRLFLVPGNHDIQRKKAEQSWEQMRKLALMPHMSNALSDWMGGMDAPFGAQEAWREEIAQRADDFWKWVEFDLGRACLLPRNSAHRRLGYRVRVDGLSLPFDVHVIGFDSAWLCGDHHDTGKLRLTPGQVNLLIQGENVPSQVGFRLALVHHPLSALAEDNQCFRLLANGVDLLLHGHQHDPIAKVSSDPDRQLTVLATGSLYADEGDRWINAFHLIEAYLDDQGQPLRYRVTFWGYSDRGHWYRTGAIYKNAVDGVLELPARLDLQLRGATPATGSADRADSIGARDLNNPSMPLATLQELLIERLSRPDVGRLWHAVLETRMDDEMGQRSKGECVIELIQQAKSRDKLPGLTQELRKIRPELLGP